MKTKIFIISMASAFLLACSPPEEHAIKQIDSTENTSADSTSATDTVTSTGSMSGSNGTGTDTTDTKRQKATREAGNH